MNHISLTDISGNKLYPDSKNNFLPFVILRTDHPIIFLNKNKFNENIYNLKYSIITDVLSFYNIDPYSFTTLGDIWNKGKFPNNFPILLVNTSNKISKYPADFIKIDSTGENNIWEPIDPTSTFIPLSFIASRNKPSIFISRLINKKYLKNIDLNKFNFLSSQFKNDVFNKIHPGYSIQGEFISVPNNNLIMPVDGNNNLDPKVITSNIWNNLNNIRGRKVVLYESATPWYEKSDIVKDVIKDESKCPEECDNIEISSSQKFNNFFLIFLLIFASIFIFTKIYQKLK